MALLRLFAEWSKAKRRYLPTVLIVDHGLREGSAKEAVSVAKWAGEAGIEAQVLRVSGPRPRANIEEKARAARYALMGEWCAKQGVPALFVAHTLDDQAETFLLRLGRGSGVDGLSGMRPYAPFPVKGFPGVVLMRPLLDFRRAELRAYLEASGVRWLEDPMNADSRFARTRIREAIPALEGAGVPVSRIASAAAHLARARDALEAETENFLASHARVQRDGSALLDAAALGGARREIGLRALSAVLMSVSGETYRPRFVGLERLFGALVNGSFSSARTLHSCRVGRAPRAERLFGAQTLKITPEAPRRSSLGGAPASVSAVPVARPSRSKSPQKGRSIRIICKS
jgi:tRNA(Ile)-lysidine synthase